MPLNKFIRVARAGGGRKCQANNAESGGVGEAGRRRGATHPSQSQDRRALRQHFVMHSIQLPAPSPTPPPDSDPDDKASRTESRISVRYKRRAKPQRIPSDE